MIWNFNKLILDHTFNKDKNATSNSEDVTDFDILVMKMMSSHQGYAPYHIEMNIKMKIKMKIKYYDIDKLSGCTNRTSYDDDETTSDENDGDKHDGKQQETKSENEKNKDDEKIANYGGLKHWLFLLFILHLLWKTRCHILEIDMIHQLKFEACEFIWLISIKHD